MTVLRRRDLLKAGALVGAVALPTGAGAVRQKMPLVVIDSRLAETRGFLRTQPAARRIDLARAEATRWTAIRSGLPQGRPVEGLTRWSDYIGLRGELEAQGLRVVHETLVDRARAGRSSLVRWGMAPR